MIHQEALKSGALISGKSDSIQEEIDDLVAQLTVASGEHICCIFLSTDQVLGMEKLLVSSIPHLINAGWLEIDLDCTWNKFASLKHYQKCKKIPLSLERMSDRSHPHSVCYSPWAGVQLGLYL